MLIAMYNLGGQKMFKGLYKLFYNQNHPKNANFSFGEIKLYVLNCKLCVIF